MAKGQFKSGTTPQDLEKLLANGPGGAERGGGSGGGFLRGLFGGGKKERSESVVQTGPKMNKWDRIKYFAEHRFQDDPDFASLTPVDKAELIRIDAENARLAEGIAIKPVERKRAAVSPDIALREILWLRHLLRIQKESGVDPLIIQSTEARMHDYEKHLARGRNEPRSRGG